MIASASWRALVGFTYPRLFASGDAASCTATIDDEFEVKLGRIGNRRARKATSYLRRVRQEADKAGASSRASVELLPAAGSAAGTRKARCWPGAARAKGQRRVVIKARIVRIKAGDAGAVRAHLRYVQRDGVTREGEPGELYDAGNDRADGKAFTERSAGDRHQFRFIVAPEDSAELADLKPFVRDLMRQMEQDLGTRLDWVAADHFNTGHPHSHIVLRGRDDEGQGPRDRPRLYLSRLAGAGRRSHHPGARSGDGDRGHAQASAGGDGRAVHAP